jgi:hypothetical protein
LNVSYFCKSRWVSSRLIPLPLSGGANHMTIPNLFENFPNFHTRYDA